MDSRIKQDMTAFVKRDGTLPAGLKYLTGIPGAGLLPAVITVAETRGFAGVESIRQPAGCSGLDVRVCESGRWKGQRRFSKRGNRFIRGAL
jgi:transposase